MTVTRGQKFPILLFSGGGSASVQVHFLGWRLPEIVTSQMVEQPAKQAARNSSAQFLCKQHTEQSRAETRRGSPKEG